MKHWGTIRIWFSEEDQEYVAACDDYPSLSWLAKTPHAALEGLGELVFSVEAEKEKE